MKLNEINLKKVAIGCGIAFSWGILFGFALFPHVVKFILKMQVSLKKGTDVRDIWEKTPFPLDFLIYVFNITNPDEFINGGKLKVEEIGPYYFEEWKDKYDLIENKTEDTIDFTMRNKFIFRPDKSNGLTGEEIITIPDILYMGISIMVKRERPALLELVTKGLEILFPHGKSVMRVNFMDVFFRGIPIDCKSDDFAAKAICSALGEAKGVKEFNETTFLFSLLGSKNNTADARLKVCRGVKNIHKLGKVIEVNGEPELDIWNGDECNQFRGTDSTIFPPFLSPEDGLWAYTPDICRSMAAVYKYKTKYSGMPASRYHLDMGDIKADESLHCFCNDPPDDCPLKGTMNLQPCTNAPLIASMPHFYNGDDSLFENIEGLNPNEHDHAVFVDFEIISGTPFQAAKRLQFNLDQEPVEGIESLSKIKQMIIPLFWVEEGVKLNKTWTSMVKPLFIAKTFNKITRLLCIIFGGIGMIASIYFNWKKSQSIDVTTIVTTVENATGIAKNIETDDDSIDKDSNLNDVKSRF